MVPAVVTNCTPIPWADRASASTAPPAQAVQKALDLIRGFLHACREPALLIAPVAYGLSSSSDEMMSGAGGSATQDEFILYVIPFNASCAWRRERQLATHMLANGSSAAPTYAAVSALLAETPVTISLDACERHPFYIIANLIAPPPTAAAPAATPPTPQQSTAAAQPTAPAPSKRKLCRNGPDCPNKAKCQFNHTPQAASGSTRPSRPPQASGAKGNASAPPRAAASAPKGWGPPP